MDIYIVRWVIIQYYHWLFGCSFCPALANVRSCQLGPTCFWNVPFLFEYFISDPTRTSGLSCIFPPLALELTTYPTSIHSETDLSATCAHFNWGVIIASMLSQWTGLINIFVCVYIYVDIYVSIFLYLFVLCGCVLKPIDPWCYFKLHIFRILFKNEYMI